MLNQIFPSALDSCAHLSYNKSRSCLLVICIFLNKYYKRQQAYEVCVSLATVPDVRDKFTLKKYTDV